MRASHHGLLPSRVAVRLQARRLIVVSDLSRKMRPPIARLTSGNSMRIAKLAVAIRLTVGQLNCKQCINTFPKLYHFGAVSRVKHKSV